MDKALIDQLVCSLKDEGTQKPLLTETELSFAKAVDVAQEREAAARNARQLQEMLPSMQEVKKVSAGEGTNCYRCGKAGHRASQCLMISAMCYSCGKDGTFGSSVGGHGCPLQVVGGSANEDSHSMEHNPAATAVLSMIQHS